MIHPNTIVKFINTEIGHGVFASSFIPKGTIMWVRDSLDREFSKEDLDRLNTLQREMLLNHSFRNNKGNFILCWDHTRYVNHSFSPNSFPTPYGFEVAIRDIREGDQITNDYGFFNIIEPFEPVNEDSGRKTVTPDDLLTHYKQWDQTIAEVLPLIFKIEQPLFSLVQEETLNEVSRVISGEAEMRSVREMWFDPRA